MDRSVNAPAVSPDLITKAVYYAGSDEVKEGEPFVYDTGHGSPPTPATGVSSRSPFPARAACASA